MKKILAMLAVTIAAFGLSGCGSGTIEQGNAGLRYNWEKKLTGTEGEGFYWQPFGRVDEYTLKEVTISFENLRPKAKDDLSLAELDVDVAYRVTSRDALARLIVKRSGSSAQITGTDYSAPAYNYVKQVSESEIADATSKFDSLTIHKSRDALAESIKKQLQEILNLQDPGDIQVTRVQVRKALPDASVEASIRNVINKEKEEQAARLSVQIAEQNALANAKTANTLTPSFLQHEYNQVLMKFAERGGTIILDGSSSSKILNLK